MKMDEERIVRCFDAIADLRPRSERMAADLERAERVAMERAWVPDAKRSPLFAALLRSRGLRAAAVLCIGVWVVLRLFDAEVEIDGASAALAKVMQALDKPRILYEVLETREGDGGSHRSEWWYDFESRVLLAKYSQEGRCTKISRLDYRTMEDVVHYPDANEVRIVYRCDVSPDGFPSTAGQIASGEIERRISRGAKVERERGRRGEADVDEYRSTIEQNEHRLREVSTLVVDRATDLPISMETKMWSKEGVLALEQTIAYEFPAAAPQDIYAVGAPRSAPVVLDVAAKRRYEQKLAIEEQIPRLEAEWARVLREDYRLADGQALALVPPALARSRIALQQARDTVRALVDEQVRERDVPLRAKDAQSVGPGDPSGVPSIPTWYEAFAWNGGIDVESSRPMLREGASLKDGIDRIVGLSVFEYEIPTELADVNIPGDWIVRKGSSKEDRLAAFEAIAQARTGRAIRFEIHSVQREVIVARGVFHFQPLSGSYNDSWIHIYADQLDPDERGGGGSGTLEKFVRILGDVVLNQHVLDETQGDRDVEVSYGCHRSGYVRSIADQEERGRKLRMVLENLSRQTGLSFSIEQRTVPVWRAIEDVASR